MNKLLRDSRGATSVEYLTLIGMALLAVGAIAALGAGISGGPWEGSHADGGSAVGGSGGRDGYAVVDVGGGFGALGEDPGSFGVTATGGSAGGRDVPPGVVDAVFGSGSSSAGDGSGDSTGSGAGSLTEPSSDRPPMDPGLAATVLRTHFDAAAGGDRFIEEDDLRALAGDDEAPPMLRAAADYLLEERAARSAIDTGAGRGDVDGRISTEDLEGTIGATAGISGAGWGSPTEGVSGAVDTVGEAGAVLRRYEFLADTAAGRGDRDGHVSDDDLRAITENEALPPELRDAARVLLGEGLEMDDGNLEEPCEGWTCGFRDFGRAALDFGGDVLDVAADVGGAAADFGGRLLRGDVAAWSDLGSGLWDFGSGLVQGVWSGVTGIAGLGWDLLQYGGSLITDPQARADAWAGISGFATDLWNDPVGTLQGVGEGAVRIGGALLDHYAQALAKCTTEFEANACGRALGEEVLIDAALAVATGGTATVIKRAIGTADDIADAARVANAVHHVAPHLDEVATHLDDVAPHLDDVARHAELGRLYEVGDRIGIPRNAVDNADMYARMVAHQIDNRGANVFIRPSDEAFTAGRMPYLDNATGGDQLLFRGERIDLNEAFTNGLPVRPHKNYHLDFPDGTTSNVYASTSTDPSVSLRFVSPNMGDHVFVLRGRNSVDEMVELYPRVGPDKQTLIRSEQEWAMHEIRGDDIIGAYRSGYDPNLGSGFATEFIPNPNYRIPGLDPSRGRRTATELSNRVLDEVPVQATDDLGQLYRDATNAWYQLDFMTRTTAAGTGGEAIVPGLKSVESTLRKLDQPGFTVERTTDIARTRIVYDSMDEVYAAVDHITQNYDVVRLSDRFQTPMLDGYRDIKINVRMPNGHIAEVQLHLRAMHEVTELGGGHHIYEEMRQIWARAANEDRPLTAAENARLVELQGESVAMYEATWAQATGGGTP